MNHDGTPKEQRGMPRKPLIVALVVVALHVCITLTLSTSTLGSLLANTLQNFACGFAVVMAFAAYRRGRGLSRPSCLLLASGIAMGGIPNLGLTYYAVGLHGEPPTGVIVRFLFRVASDPLPRALFS